MAFAGSAEFSLCPLLALADSSHRVSVVVTSPARAGSRGRPARRPVAELAAGLGLPILQPERLSASDLAAACESDVLVVCAYGQILPSGVISRFPKGAVGIHPSLLPRYRGASPVQAALLAGDTVTGVTIFQMEARLDAGPILAQEAVQIPDGVSAPHLAEELARLGGEMVVRVLDSLEAGRLEGRRQSEGAATYCRKLARKDGELDWERPAAEIGRRLRALQPWPGVTVPLGGDRVKLLSGKPASPAGSVGQLPPGSLIPTTGEGVLVATADSPFLVELIQPPGGRPMSPTAFLRGSRGPSAAKLP